MDIIKPSSLSALGQAEADANETFAAGKAQAQAVDAGITGEVIKIGDIRLEGEMCPGLVVMCYEDDLKDMPVNLYGKMVRITPITLCLSSPCPHCNGTGKTQNKGK